MMQETGRHVALVRDDAGNVVHTHQAIYLAGAEPLTEEKLLAEAVAAAERAHTHTERLVAALSSPEELARIRDETARREYNRLRRARHR